MSKLTIGKGDQGIATVGARRTIGFAQHQAQSEVAERVRLLDCMETAFQTRQIP
jgi:hypothetical protein